MASHTHGNIWDAITMNLLLLYMYEPDYDFDNWLHMKFAEYLANKKIILTGGSRGIGLSILNEIYKLKKRPHINPLSHHEKSTLNYLKILNLNSLNVQQIE